LHKTDFLYNASFLTYPEAVKIALKIQTNKIKTKKYISKKEGFSHWIDTRTLIL